jgi:hypothetical protein
MHVYDLSLSAIIEKPAGTLRLAALIVTILFLQVANDR